MSDSAPTPTLPTLAQRMRDLADTGHSHAAALRRQADILEADIERAFADKEDAAAVWRMLSSWTRARQVWCAATGDTLI